VRPGRRGEEGLAVIYLALTITSVLLAGAFAVDLGYWYVRAQQAQRAADAAALAGVIWMPGDFTQAKSVALASAKANGFDDTVNGVSVQVSQGATPRQLTVRITDDQVDRFLSSVSTKDRVSIGRSAVAQYELPIPLGAPENQFGAGLNGVYLAVNGFCTRRGEGDNRSAAYYNVNSTASPPASAISCPTALPYDQTTPAAPVAKNLDYKSSGYTYVVNIPPKQTAGCGVASPPPDCSRTKDDVTIQLQDPLLNRAAAPQNDQYNFPNAANPPSEPCNGPPPPTTRPGTTFFSVRGVDNTPLDDSDNPVLRADTTGAPDGVTSQEASAPPVTSWDDLYTVPAGSASGRYLVRVHSKADEGCSAWSNSFGIRARIGAGPAFTQCSSIVGAPLYSQWCPQVHGLDAMSLRAVMLSASDTCVGTKVIGTNKCTSFYLAQVDPAYAGRQMAITLFDPDEGAQRLRVLAPGGTAAAPTYTPISFTYKTTDSAALLSCPAVSPCPMAASGLDVSGTTFNDRKVELSVTLPADVSPNGGWFKIEYEVGGTTVTDRTTWGVNIRGAPVHLVS